MVMMNRIGLSRLAVLLALALCGAEARAARKPNILFILCDDLGYGDVGVLYQNERPSGQPRIATPRLDTMAAAGMQLSSHYCPAPVCAPSRASLLTGVHQGHAEVRDNQFDKALANNYTLASVLNQAGYSTFAIGKWGLQGEGTSPSEWPAYPTRRGFDHYFGAVRHVDGHMHYPAEEYPGGEREKHRQRKQVWYDNQEISSQLDKCYTTDLFTAFAKKVIVEQTRQHPDSPFFIYLAYDTPHAILQVPTQAYPKGSGLNGGVQWTGIPGRMINTASGTVDSYIHPDCTGSGWGESEQRFATMVRRIDDCVGDLRQTLQDLGIAEDTLVVFTSDNGPHDESYIEHLMHSANDFDSFGPFDGIKRDAWEGGIRMPTLVCQPGTVPPGSASLQPSAFWDWMPTFAELAGVPAPSRTDGVSLVPTLTGREGQRSSLIYIEYDVAGKTPNYPEFEASHRGRYRKQMQVIMMDGYKGVRYNVQRSSDDFEIYDVISDPKESENLAEDPAFADLQRRMKERVLQVRRPSADAPRPYDHELLPPVSPCGVMRGGMVDRTVFAGDWPWVPDFRAMPAGVAGEVSQICLPVHPEESGYGVLFSGYLKIPSDGEYTFFIDSDAGSSLRIHEALVIDDDYSHNGSEASATILLKAGYHPFRLSYRHRHGHAKLKFQYSGPGFSRRDVPSSALFLPEPEAGNSEQSRRIERFP